MWIKFLNDYGFLEIVYIVYCERSLTNFWINEIFIKIERANDF